MSRAFTLLLSFVVFFVAVGATLAVPSLPADEKAATSATLAERSALLHTVMTAPEVVFQRFRAACLRDFQQPDHLRVTIHETPTARLAGGYFSHVELEATGGGVDYVKLANFKLHCDGVHFDLEKLMLEDKLDVRRVDKMDLALTVNEDAFNTMFRTHASRLRVRNPVVKMYDGELAFSGSIKAFLFKSRISARGPIELMPDGRVNFNLRRLQVSGLNLPGFVVDQIARTINPITDFKNFRFWDCWNMNLRSVVVREGSLTLSSFPDDDPALATADAGPVAAIVSSPMLSKPGVYVLE